MNGFDWQAELHDWCRSHRELPDDWQPALLKLFSLSFQNTRLPDRAWFGTHRTAASLVVGGIFLTACYRKRHEWVVSLLADQNPPAIAGVRYEPVKSTARSPHPLLWADTTSLAGVQALLSHELFWASFGAATIKIGSATQIATDRDEVQVRRGKHRLSEFWAATSPVVVLAVPPGSGLGTAPPDFSEMLVAEGRELLRLHRTRERSRGLVARKKRSVLAEFGRLACEACGFDFATAYGPRGDGFAECHHTQPISQSAPGRHTRLSELAVVCANCHRMLHRRPWVSVPELRELVRSRLGVSQVAEPGAATDGGA